jgi:hypothetical protein
MLHELQLGIRGSYRNKEYDKHHTQQPDILRTARKYGQPKKKNPEQTVNL